MGWFTNLCRNVGLMVHNIRHPESGRTNRKVIRREVEEERKGNVTLRRTTIEEIEVRRGAADSKDDAGREDR